MYLMLYKEIFFRLTVNKISYEQRILNKFRLNYIHDFLK